MQTWINVSNIFYTGLNNPINTVYHLQPVMILTLLPLAFLIDGM